MADTKISGLSAIVDLATDDEFVLVDKSDTTMAASGTNKKITYDTLRANMQGILQFAARGALMP